MQWWRLCWGTKYSVLLGHSSCKENLLALDLWFVLMSCALGLVMLLNVLCKNKKYWVTCITVLPLTVKAEATDELSHDLLIYRSILQDQGRLLRGSSSVFSGSMLSYGLVVSSPINKYVLKSEEQITVWFLQVTVNLTAENPALLKGSQECICHRTFYYSRNTCSASLQCCVYSCLSVTFLKSEHLASILPSSQVMLSHQLHFGFQMFPACDCPVPHSRLSFTFLQRYTCSRLLESYLTARWVEVYQLRIWKERFT